MSIRKEEDGTSVSIWSQFTASLLILCVLFNFDFAKNLNLYLMLQRKLIPLFKFIRLELKIINNGGAINLLLIIIS